MKFLATVFGIAIFLASQQSGFSQGFLNLNFEAANLSGYSPGSADVPITNAFPSWSGYMGSTTYGTQQVSEVGYNTANLGGGEISVIDTNRFGLGRLQGKYSLFLQGSSAAGPYSFALGQTGLIPNATQSLIFWGAFAGSATFNGQTITYAPIGNIGSYTIYAGDISAFAGQIGELRFTVSPNSGGILDNIQFSTQPIPEPSVLSLFALGGLFFAFRCWKNSPR